MSASDGSASQGGASPSGGEAGLPRVPLPTLQESAERFLEWCAPLLTAEELAATERAVQEFLLPDSPAWALQAALEAYDASEGVHSWLDDFWSYRYLGRRDRIALNANFFFLFRPSRQPQLERAAGLIAAAVDVKLQLDAGHPLRTATPGRALSTAQDRFLFSATRIPGPAQDTLRAPRTDGWPGPSRERHIVVLLRGNAFRMDVLDEDGLPFSPSELERGLQAVMTAGAAPAAPGSSVGHLTSKARAEWAASRQALLDTSPVNGELLDVVETALFCLCLEDIEPTDVQQACDQLLHGDSGNRWFDKALSLVVFADGAAGLNAEHSKLDGTTILNFVDAVLQDPAPETARPGAPATREPTVRALEFVLDDGLRADIQAAADSFAAYAADTATTVLSFDDLGVNQIKQLRISPDAFVQMAYQLAHRRTKGLVGATYESIATRQYRHGRTEAMRVVTPEVLRFVAAMDDADVDVATRRAALRAAADRHVARVRDCQDGRAPEQHLWELQLLQQRRADGVPAEPLGLYDSPGWRTMRDDYLSTSSAPSANIQYFGFGSTSPQCIGIAYVLLPDLFNLYLSTPRAVSQHLVVFVEELKAALRELQDLLAGEVARA